MLIFGSFKAQYMNFTLLTPWDGFGPKLQKLPKNTFWPDFVVILRVNGTEG